MRAVPSTAGSREESLGRASVRSNDRVCPDRPARRDPRRCGLGRDRHRCRSSAGLRQPGSRDIERLVDARRDAGGIAGRDPGSIRVARRGRRARFSGGPPGAPCPGGRGPGTSDPSIPGSRDGRGALVDRSGSGDRNGARAAAFGHDLQRSYGPGSRGPGQPRRRAPVPRADRQRADARLDGGSRPGPHVLQSGLARVHRSDSRRGDRRRLERSGPPR